jgi:hypothetical protein
MRPPDGRRNKPLGRSSLDQLDQQRQHRLQTPQLPVLSTLTSVARSPAVFPRPYLLLTSTRHNVFRCKRTRARVPTSFLPCPHTDAQSRRSSAGQPSASVSHTVSTTRPPSLLPTSSARTRRSTSASSPSSTRLVKSTRRRPLPRPSLVVCRIILFVNFCLPTYTRLQPSPTPATPSSTSSLGSSRSNRRFTLHILPHRPGHISHPRSHEEDACFLIPTTKCDLTYAPRARHDHLPRAVVSTDTRPYPERRNSSSQIAQSPRSRPCRLFDRRCHIIAPVASPSCLRTLSVFSQVYLLCKNRLRFCSLRLLSEYRRKFLFFHLVTC